MYSAKINHQRGGGGAGESEQFTKLLDHIRVRQIRHPAILFLSLARSLNVHIAL